MKIETKTIKIKNTGIFSTEEIETQLNKQKINPVRWAIVKIEKNFYYLSVSYTLD